LPVTDIEIQHLGEDICISGYVKFRQGGMEECLQES